MVKKPVLPGTSTLIDASASFSVPRQLATVHWVAVPSHVADVVRLLSGASGPKSLPVPLKSLDCLAATAQAKPAGAHGLPDVTVATTVATTAFPGGTPRLRSWTMFPDRVAVPVPTETPPIEKPAGTVRFAEPSVWLVVRFVNVAWNGTDTPAGTVFGEMTTEYGLVAAPAGEARAQAPRRGITNAAACLRGRGGGTGGPSP